MTTSRKLTALAGLIGAIAVLGPVASANGAASICPDSRICKPARPDGVSSKSSAAQPKIVPQRTSGNRGQEAWRSGKWLME